MYLFKSGIEIEINKTEASEIIGISRVHLSNILNGKVVCSKTTAYCITKFLNSDADIEDYFDKRGE